MYQLNLISHSKPFTILRIKAKSLKIILQFKNKNMNEKNKTHRYKTNTIFTLLKA